jgi:methyl-accepting chemotaxis protein
MKLNDIRVATKMWGTILGLLVLMLGVSAFTQYRSSQAMDRALADVQRYESNITAAVRWRGLTETNTERSLAGIATSDELIEKFFAGRQDAGSALISEVQAGVRATAVSDADKQALANVGEARGVLLGKLKKLPEVKASADPGARRDFALKEFLPTSVAYVDALKGFVKVQEVQRDEAKAEARQAQHHAALLGLSSAAVVLVIGIVLASLLVRSITRPLDRAVAVAGAIAGGDLTQRIHATRKDEFGQLLQALSQMVGKLHGVVTEVRRGVDSVSTASSEIAHGNQDLSSRTEQTASNLEETAASMEELTSTVSQSSDTAQQANQLAAGAAKAAAYGGEVVGQVVVSMQQISDSSRKIADIIGVIDGIAFQTNILALNAAVEAARAGEQGRGFAVVAGEVRNLAQRSAQAAKEIKTLIGASVETVEKGSAQVSQAGQAMGDIVGGVRRMTDLIAEIAAAANEQRDGIGQVNQAVTNLDQMTQQNAALVEESTAAAASMRDQAQKLAEVVSMFNLGTVAAAQAAPAAPRAMPAPAARPATAAARRASPVPPPALLRKPAATVPATAPRATAKGADEDWESF